MNYNTIIHVTLENLFLILALFTLTIFYDKKRKRKTVLIEEMEMMRRNGTSTKVQGGVQWSLKTVLNLSSHFSIFQNLTAPPQLHKSLIQNQNLDFEGKTNNETMKNKKCFNIHQLSTINHVLNQPLSTVTCSVTRMIISAEKSQSQEQERSRQCVACVIPRMR